MRVYMLSHFSCVLLFVFLGITGGRKPSLLGELAQLEHRWCVKGRLKGSVGPRLGKTRVTDLLHLQPKVVQLEVKALDSAVSYSVRSDFVTSWTTALQAPQSMGFSSQE